MPRVERTDHQPFGAMISLRTIKLTEQFLPGEVISGVSHIRDGKVTV